MLKGMNITKFLRLLVIILPVMFMLSGCNDKGMDADNPKSEQELAEEQRACWQDKVMTLLYDTMGTLAMQTYKNITAGAMNLMMVAFSIWFVFRLMKFVSSVSEENSGQVWNEVLKQLLVCLFCGILASSTDGLLTVLNMIVFPIYNAFLELGSEILTVAGDGFTNGGGTGEYVFLGMKMPDSSVVCKIAGRSEATLQGFPEAPRTMMNCMICAVNERLSFGNFLAYQVMRAPGITPTLVGLLVLCCFTIIKLAFVFYLVDTVFRFTMMIVLLPLLIMGYAFPQTKGWTGTGLKTMLNSAAFMMAISIMIAMALMAIVQILQDNTVIEPGQDPKVVFSEFNGPVLAIMLIAFMIIGTMGVAGQIASSLIGGGGSTRFQELLKGLLSWAAALLTGGFSKALMEINKVKQAADKVKAAKGKYNNFKAKMNKFAGRK